MKPVGIHEILAFKFYQTSWDPGSLSNQTSSNPLESDGIHEILAIKSHQTKWNLMGLMGSRKF